jgi:hypothetical protein
VNQEYITTVNQEYITTVNQEYVEKIYMGKILIAGKMGGLQHIQDGNDEPED